MPRSSGVGFRIGSPATMEERRGRFRNLTTLRQRGSEVGGLAQLFWTMAVGMGYNDAALKDFFNNCLDDPLPQWEMKGLEILDFWGFTHYLCHRAQWDTSTTPVSPEKRAASPAPQHKMAANPAPQHKMAASPAPQHKMAASSAPQHKMAASPAPQHKMAASPAPQHEMTTSPAPLHRRVESTPVLADKMVDSTPESSVKEPPARHQRGRRRRRPASVVPQSPEDVPEQAAAVQEDVPEQAAAV